MVHRIPKSSRNRQILAAVIVAVAVTAVVGGVAWTRSGDSGSADGSVATYAVRQGPLTISVVESGTIKSQDQVILKNEVEGQVTLIYLIPEGTRVKEGELLAELDASQLQDNRVERVIRLQNAEAAFIRARENLAVVKSQAESDVAQADLDYRFAQTDLNKYIEGDYPQLLKEAESKIKLAEEEQRRAEEKLNWSQRLRDEKYISDTELQADEIAFSRANVDLELAKAEKDLLEKYTKPRQIEQLESDIAQANRALERVKLRANSDIVQAEADLTAAEAEYEQEKSKLADIDRQISLTKIYAPRAGLVVYATSVQSRRWGGQQPLEEGQSVRERQELIYLPSTDSMMAELMIHESSLEKVQIGQYVSVTVDAVPGRSFAGRVHSIAPLPDAQSTWMNPDLKLYPTKVTLDGANPDLRTGMSCRAEIVVAQLPDAVYVPIQAVTRLNGKPTVFVRNLGRFESRPVEIGMDNNNLVHVVSGLQKGEVVSLLPPLDTGAREETELAQAGPNPGAGGVTPVATPAAAAPGPGNPGVVNQRRRDGAQDGETRGPRQDRGDGSDAERAAERERFRNMSPEEREAEMRKRMEQMTPEQREEMMKRMRERQGGGGNGGGPGGGTGP